MTYYENHSSYAELIVDADVELVLPDLVHAEESLRWVQSDEVIRFMGAEFGTPTLEGERKRIADILSDRDAYHWMIRSDDRIVGNVNINDIAAKTKAAGVKSGNLTILIGDPDHWGKGLATKVCRSALHWAKGAAFEVMNARALRENEGSIRTLQKLGFAETGTEPYEGLVHGKTSEWRTFRREL